MSKLKELRERVERASGPDREIDYAIASALLDATKEPNYWFWQSGREQGAPLRPVNAYWTDRRTPRFTTSIDAALALVERTLAVYSIRVTIDPSGEGTDLTWWPDGLSGERELHFAAVSNSACLAILSALLSALDHRESSNG